MDTHISEEPQSPSRSSPGSSFTTRRSLRQLGLFLVGATLFVGAQIVTRRAVICRLRAPAPPFYHPSNVPYLKVNRAMDALDAFSLATMNVVCAATMLAGGTMWALDISTLDDLRSRVKHRVGTGDAKQTDEECDAWIAELLSRDDMKGAVKAATGVQLDQFLADAKAKHGDHQTDRGPGE